MRSLYQVKNILNKQLDNKLEISIGGYLTRAQPESTTTRYSSPLNFLRFLLV